MREIADAAGILSGSLYHHFDSKESIGDEILSGFINEVLADYRGRRRVGRRARAPRSSRSSARPAAPWPGTGPP